MDIGVYILPGQSFEIIFTPDEDIGMDATVCNKLLDRGIQISPENVDNFKKDVKDKGDRFMNDIHKNKIKELKDELALKEEQILVPIIQNKS